MTEREEEPKRKDAGKQSKVWRRIGRGAGLVMCGAMLMVGGWCMGTLQSRSDNVMAATPAGQLSSQLTTEKVMVVGGSMAHGWKDPNNDSYLRRAFQALSNSTDTQYEYDDRTVVGGSPVGLDKSGKYATWLAEDKPQIVVISWGLLNDVYDKTPMASFNQAIHNEIQEALAANAVVIFVTSPVTKATATYNHAEVENYIATEQAQASSFDNPNIYFIDLNHDMSVYMAAHGQTWQSYYGDSWHPNEAGHELAGELLFDDFIATFGTGSIEWQSPGSGESTGQSYGTNAVTGGNV
ncbi:GDSL-like lipase/acylhydrolase family protein [Alicyclobacillus sacchari]|uniref:GDSL-like lipase/acylhydrolase family protein n=1 Tax=Alicyclobacillus sacchari TaxID=392010 RepID=A0A4R8LR29_9BACL|nr:GDSL-like lipase/acylhydrolase family protein [Alicyclobacillus sacchari]